MEINVKQARSKISEMLDQIEKGAEMVILRRGKKVARLVPFDITEKKRLPDLKKFRDSISCNAESLGNTVLLNRNDERF